ncbi:hypothetical protein GpSGHVEth101 [Glossina pallidipes salivary gland hypertrophy virus]|uniref:Uncharacterized protein n=2 Tax=Glossina hytrovirus (isolate Glossina pallidipes/Ethiopia/Seibersdorf/-) TaxID=379529 RepID=A0A0Y0JI06_GHVS|nr:hypothetical protein SGHV092 [Glossina pallidipes salivary gland hypertrophy virus]ABQ08865.1 hypothetical protein SGHV092 [Glossina pallidipes salivary gland hypertrophy virus]AMB48705.1 hypothetical protein GpSGHVEth101 [Glossina pallidipes salivary gland hypertrophy virus]
MADEEPFQDVVVNTLFNVNKITWYQIAVICLMLFVVWMLFNSPNNNGFLTTLLILGIIIITTLQSVLIFSNFRLMGPKTPTTS